VFSPAEIATYDMNRKDEAPAVVERLLADPQALGELARAGALRALSEHTWRQRAQTIVEAVTAVA